MLNQSQFNQVVNKINNDYMLSGKVYVSEYIEVGLFKVSFVDRIDGRMFVWMGFDIDGSLLYA